MKRGLRSFLAAILTAVLLSFTVIPASAQAAVPAQTTCASTPCRVESASSSADGFLSSALSGKRVTAVTRLSAEDVEAISGRLAEHSSVYLVELQDGWYTYYMAVDFRDDDAVYFSKLAVMRATSHKLYARSEAMAADEVPDGRVWLMPYPHIIGELSLHYFGYRFTDALGGEKLPGLLGRVYRSCVVANLNIDEGRMAAVIRMLGKLLG